MSGARLSNASLGIARSSLPGYDRSAVRPGIVHLGLGAFARAHFAVYVDDLLAAGHADLGIIGVSLRHRDVQDALVPQDGLYLVGALDGDGVHTRLIGSVLEVLHAPSQPAQVRAALAAPATQLVTVTVTEKGYCWLPSSTALDLEHPDIAHDLHEPTLPRSLPGHLVLAAADRMHSGAPGLTVLSLDNVPSNGDTLRALVIELADHIDLRLGGWIAQHMAFPCSMVDRMVPATDDEFRAEIAALSGVQDAWPVRAERFRQWVLEHRAAAAPDAAGVDAAPPDPTRVLDLLGTVGVTLTDDVASWEHLKLRVLNGLHTTAALFGLRNGLPTVDDVTRHPDGAALLRRVCAEVVEVVVAPPGADVADYARATLDRFANPRLGHRCEQIATDSSQKLPQRLLGTLRDRRALGLPSPAITEVIALWAWSALGVDHTGATRTVRDPLAEQYRLITGATGRDAGGLARALMAIEPVFGDLSGDADLIGAVATDLVALLAHA